jgi:hypothetical protein
VEPLPLRHPSRKVAVTTRHICQPYICFLHPKEPSLAIAITNPAATTPGHQAAPGLRSPSSSPSDSFTCAEAHSSTLQSTHLDTSCSNMSDTDEEASPSRSGYLTPPLSPTKTISTEGWASPRTPQSPRKSRSCRFFRDIDSGFTSHCLTPPSSPRKSKFLSRLEALSTPDLSPTAHVSVPVLPNDETPSDDCRLIRVDPSFSYSSPTLARSHTRSSPVRGAYSLDDKGLFPPAKGCDLSPLRDGSFSSKRRRRDRSSSDSTVEGLSHAPSPSLSPADAVTTFESPNLPSLRCTDISAEDSSPPSKLRRLPLRYASSPLRSSQWLARGGSLASPRQSQTSTLDRFIASRRPPAVTRESFELNSPAERRNKEQNTNQGTRTGADAFSPRLRRSGRMNEELRSLREAHSVVSGRANANRRNVNFRRNPLPLGARQISAGAVWNVGGPSAVSDTVVAVSTGRGRMLGSGTNAPLYKSAFLNRADPDAELEAYERRLAVALDIDQTDRILQHSSPLVSSSSPHSGPASQAKHVWRDGAWIKDGVHSSLFRSSLSTGCCSTANYSHKLPVKCHQSEDPCQSYLSDMFFS